jgi:energy-converting hydrogenase Eha subunit A
VTDQAVVDAVAEAAVDAVVAVMAVDAVVKAVVMAVVAVVTVVLPVVVPENEHRVCENTSFSTDSPVLVKWHLNRLTLQIALYTFY